MLVIMIITNDENELSHNRIIKNIIIKSDNSAPHASKYRVADSTFIKERVLTMMKTLTNTKLAASTKFDNEPNIAKLPAKTAIRMRA